MISEPERAALVALARAGRIEHRIATLARILLCAADGTANKGIAKEFRASAMTVLLWRDRFETDRLDGLRDAPRPGRAPIHDRAERDRVIPLTLEPSPDGTTHWSARRTAARTGIGIMTIQRIWGPGLPQAHRTETFKWCTDPELVTKVHEVVGLYLDPHAGRSCCRSTRRPRSRRSIGPSRCCHSGPVRSSATRTTYERHGTDEAVRRAGRRHSVLAFLRQIDRVYCDQDLHVVLDNVSTRAARLPTERRHVASTVEASLFLC